MPDGEWELVSGSLGSDNITPTADEPITLSAAGNSWSGWDGCNNYELTVEVAAAGKVQPLQLNGEDAGCPTDAAGEAAERYSAALLRLDRYSRTDGELLLLGEDVELRFEPDSIDDDAASAEPAPPTDEPQVATAETSAGEAALELLADPAQVGLDTPIELRLANRGDVLLWYGLHFTVERWDEGAWRQVPWPDDFQAPDVQESLPPGERTHSHSWPPEGRRHSRPGWYRASWTASVGDLDPEVELEARVQFEVRG